MEHRTVMTVASLCTGIGGIDLAFEMAGARTVFQCEQNKDCNRVLAHHWPDVERTEDVNARATERALRRLRPDIIAFGSPCQDLSVAGKRDGLAGERSGLFFRCMELAYSCAAQWILFENVPGLHGSNAGEDFASVLEAFAGVRPAVPPGGWRNHGACVGPLYSCAWAVLDARWFGVPQRRRRVFVVGCLGDGAGPVEVLSLIESGAGNPPPGREAGAGTAASLRSRSARDSNPPGRGGEDDVNLVCFSELGEGHHSYQESDTVRGMRGASGGGSGKANLVGGVPFTVNSAESCAKKDHARQADVARCLDQTGGFASGQGGSVVVQSAAVARDATSHGGRLDADTENFVTHALRAEGADASEDGTGRGTPLVVDTLTDKGIIQAKGANYATSDQADPRKVLSVLRQKIGEEAFAEWGLGILDSLQSAEVLQSGVHGQVLQREAKNARRRSKLGRVAQACPEDLPKGAMREMRQAGRERRSPQGRELAKQLQRELGAYLSLLSQPKPSPAQALHCLWQAAKGVGLLRQALSAIQEVWRPAEVQAQPAQPNSNSGIAKGGAGSFGGVRRLTPL